jgi:hypothetical protein
MAAEHDHEDVPSTIDRREAIRRVTALLGGTALVGGTNLLAACEKAQGPARDTAAAAMQAFTPQDVAYLDEVAETILPATKTPGAKAAKTGAFMALMVTDAYSPADQRIFRDGMRTLDGAAQQAYKTIFVNATPEQRLALLTRYDREAKQHMDAVEAAARAKRGLPAIVPPPNQAAPGKEGDAFLSDQRQENAPTASRSNAAPAITADSPRHFFRMMKELALLGYFTSEIGYTQAMRYEETPGKWEPCLPYAPGEKTWAAHA